MFTWIPTPKHFPYNVEMSDETIKWINQQLHFHLMLERFFIDLFCCQNLQKNGRENRKIALKVQSVDYASSSEVINDYSRYL